MNKLNLYIYFILLCTLILSCREVYYPDDIESNEKIPVIYGRIMENEQPVVQLYWAVKYEDEIKQFISDAEVYISDDLGNTTQLDQAWEGNYSSWQIIGNAGITYTLRVVLSDGREYVSTPQLLQPPPAIDSIYAIPGRKTTYEYGASGKPVYTQQEGLYIHSDLSSDSQNTLYYRFNTIVVKLSSYTVDLNTPGSYSIFLWETTQMDNSYTVDYTVSSNNGQVLYRHPSGYLRYFYDVTLQSDSRTAPFTEAWIVTQKIYSISADVFQYYNSVGKQLSGSDVIFAPVASQVKSNIRCKSDITEKVIGVFEASSMTTIYKAFGWRNLVYYKFIDLPFYPEVGTGSQDRFPPDFWIYF